MKNYVCEGENISIILAGPIASGAGILMGSMFGVTKSSGVATDEIAVSLLGVFELPKASGAVALGAKVYWDDAAKNITTTVGSNVLAGYAYKAELTGATTIQVRLNTV